MNDFNTNNYTIIKKAISTEMTQFIYDYICLRRKIANYLFQKKLISPFTQHFGNWGDGQVENTYHVYGDTVMEILLLKIKPLIEKQIEQELIEMYSYCRIYKKDDLLDRHKDRMSCEISTTLNLGGDPWPIYLDPTKGKNQSGIKIELNAGDMLIYRGCVLEHWRESFQGNNCAQVFLHYNIKNEDSEKIKYDTREFIGVPRL
jgi:hypothetical protein|tara:strand:+ start:421 stop:1029 length:609 start_codon:yes stop_codon:yes gene_type:complete